MWLYRTVHDAQAPIIFYDYKPSISGSNPEYYLSDFKGYLHTDGYIGYEKGADASATVYIVL